MSETVGLDSSPASTSSRQVYATPETAQYRKPPLNSPAFFRIVVHNLDRSQEFYSAIFGWRFMEPQPNFPRIFFTGGEVMGGLHPRSSSDTGDVAEEGQKDEAHRKQRVVNYILVDDVDEVLRKVKANGGIVVKDKFTEGNHSELAEFEFEGVVTGVLRWLNP